jgi:hypothetical protein
MIRNVSFEKFDRDYESLETSPYNAAQDYFNGGWDCALNKMEELFADRITGDMKPGDFIKLFRSIKKELGE